MSTVALIRALYREGYIEAEICDGTSESNPFKLQVYGTTDQWWRPWLLESLYVALTHSDERVAFRALLQAHEYYGRLGERDAVAADAMAEARTRVEAALKGGRS